MKEYKFKIDGMQPIFFYEMISDKLYKGFDKIFFDCDSTLTTIEGIDRLAEKKSLKIKEEVKKLTSDAMNGSISIENVFEKRLDIIRPTKKELEDIGQDYIDNISSGAKSLISTLKRAGKEVYVISGGYQIPLLKLADYLGIAPKNVFGVEVNFDENGEYIGFSKDSPTARAGGKTRLIEKLKGNSTAMLIGDGSTDLEAKSIVDLFIGYGGVVCRDRIRKESQLYMEIKDLNSILPFAIGFENLGNENFRKDLENAARACDSKKIKLEESLGGKSSFEKIINTIKMDKRFFSEPRDIEKMQLPEIRNFIDCLGKKVIDSVYLRSRFRKNDHLYNPNSIQKECSLLEYALNKKESYYASIGRYIHNSEFPITYQEPSEDSPFSNSITLKNKNIQAGIDIPGLINKYLDKVINPFCHEGYDIGRAGQIADIDTNVIENIHRRMQIGRYVADRKIKNNDVLEQILENYSPAKEGQIKEMLRDQKREEKVIRNAQRYAQKKFLGLKRFVPSQEKKNLDYNIKSLFRYIMDETISLEVEYLKKNYMGAK